MITGGMSNVDHLLSLFRGAIRFLNILPRLIEALCGQVSVGNLLLFWHTRIPFIYVD